MQIEMSSRTRWLLVIAAGVVMGGTLGIRNVQGLYLVPVTMDQGWSREAFSLAIAIQNLVWGLTQPFVGAIADRYGAARVIFVGALVYALGLIIMAISSTPLMFTIGSGVLIGFALSGTAFGTIYGALSRLVPPQYQSWALGVAGAVGGLGQFAAVPATHLMIAHTGWVWSLLVLALLMVLIAPLAAVLREGASHTDVKPEPVSASDIGQAVRAAMTHRGFTLLNISFIACGFQLAFIAGHLPAYLIDRGMSPADGGVALGLIAFGNIFGTYLCGLLGGLWPRKYVLSALYFTRVVIMALFVVLPPTSLNIHVLSLAMGFVWLGTVPLTIGLVSQLFGVRYIATLFGVVFFGHQVGSFFGVWLGGYAFDVTQSYELVWAVSIALGLFAAIVHLPIDDRKSRLVVIQQRQPLDATRFNDHQAVPAKHDLGRLCAPIGCSAACLS